jgi:putative aminopeptidase FrvX
MGSGGITATPQLRTSCQVAILALAGATLAVCALSQSAPRMQTRAIIQTRLRSFPATDSEREKRIRNWFTEAGCDGNHLSEQALGPGVPPNVICVLPGKTQEAVVVGAHTDHVASGDGVVDNWTGSVLLPALLYSLSAQPRHHTFVFIAFSGEEKGLVGSRYYVDHLSPDERARIEAMINFDSLGLGPTKVWASHADKALLAALIRTAATVKLPISAVNVENVGATADSESFASYNIPRITLHSVTQETWPILHSPSDTLGAIRMSDFYDSYKLVAPYLEYLDDTLSAVKPPPLNPAR